jgi:hypothetical protein
MSLPIGRVNTSEGYKMKRTLRALGRIAPLALGLVVLAVMQAGARQAPIVLDGLYDDWAGETALYTDTSGDAGASGIDLGRLWAADDLEYLYLYFEAGREIQLNSGHKLTLYLDTDANSATGIAVGGIGAELEWRFGDKAGNFKYGTTTTAIDQSDIRFRGHATVTASSFEAAIGRDSRPDGSHLLFTQPTIRILLIDTNGGDRLPNSPETLSYQLDVGTLPPETGIALGKKVPTDLRIITNNVLSDGPWGSGKGPRFGRELAALDPEIINFQEIYNHTPAQTAAFVETYLPSGAGESWYAAGNQDCKTVSRYPILQSWPIGGNLAVLLDTTPAIGKKLLIISVHLYCCTDDTGRQGEVDQILSFLRDAKSPGGTVTLDPDTPFLITGDTNFVGLAQQPVSLLTGDVVNEATYGPDFAPDWDGTNLTDLVSRQTSKRMTYTWRSDVSAFWPGRLDYQIYTDSVLDLGNHFVLYTPDMPADSLSHYGLQATDSQATDHLIVCADYRAVVPTGVAEAGPPPVRLRLAPNPSPAGASLTLRMASDGAVRLEVLDIGGRCVARPFGSGWIPLVAGVRNLAWDGQDDLGRPLPSGTYFVRVQGRDRSGSFAAQEKWTIVR